MASILRKRLIDEKRKTKVRKKLRAANRQNLPRLYMHVSNKHMYAQLIDDSSGATLLSVSTMDAAMRKPNANMANKDNAAKLAGMLVEKLKGSNVDIQKGFVFDRGSSIYHGKVKAFADTLRESGVKI